MLCVPPSLPPTLPYSTIVFFLLLLLLFRLLLKTALETYSSMLTELHTIDTGFQLWPRPPSDTNCHNIAYHFIQTSHQVPFQSFKTYTDHRLLVCHDCMCSALDDYTNVCCNSSKDPLLQPLKLGVKQSPNMLDTFLLPVPGQNSYTGYYISKSAVAVPLYSSSNPKISLNP